MGDSSGVSLSSLTAAIYGLWANWAFFPIVAPNTGDTMKLLEIPSGRLQQEDYTLAAIAAIGLFYAEED